MDFEADNLTDLLGQPVAGENGEIEPDLDVKEEDNGAIEDKVDNNNFDKAADDLIDGLNGVDDGKVDVNDDGLDPDELG